MPITGAIFDFDGTIVDSMPMWNYVPDRLLRRYGTQMTPEAFEATEPLNCDDECRWFHEHLGVGESGEALFEELRAMVRHEYETVIAAWPHVDEFLQELDDAGIPMVIASSTPADDIRVGLRAHGLEHFFKDVIFTGDVGRGKEFPDVYNYALKVLGTAKESTWVFEDAPFGVRTAHEEGYPVVAIINDHDGRDEGFLRQNCDILIHGYAELSLPLIEDFARQPGEARSGGVLHALIVDGSPEPSSARLVAALAGASDYVIAADRGAEVLRAAGYVPDVFCGDADSTSNGSAQWAHELAHTDIRFPSEKYATDLALAIDCARHEAARRSCRLQLTVTCASGGRLDHQLAVIGLLVRCADASPSVVEDAFECRVLSPQGTASWQFGAGHDAVGTTFSALALSERACVSEHGVKWELDRKDLLFLDDVGISNVVTSPDAEVICHEGVLAVFMNRSSR
jgi:thiamine pyrophosphokinase